MNKFKVGDHVYVIPGSRASRLSDGFELVVETVSGDMISTGLADIWMPPLWVKPEQLVLASEATPCQRLGLAEGDRIEVTKSCTHFQGFEVGDVLRLTQDDGSDAPWFSKESDNTENFVLIVQIGRYEPMEFIKLDKQKSIKAPTEYMDDTVVPDQDVSKVNICMIERDGTERNDDYTEHKPVPTKLVVSPENEALWKRFHRGRRK